MLECMLTGFKKYFQKFEKSVFLLILCIVKSNILLECIDFYGKLANNRYMKINGIEYITIKEIAKKLNISTNTVRWRLHYRKIKPLSRESLYDISALEAIKDFAPKGFKKGNKAQSSKKSVTNKGKNK